MKTILLSLLSIAALALSACTANQRAKTFGGTADVNLPAGQKLVGATWKENQLWYLTRPMREGETAETSCFREKSSYGMVEGVVNFRETR